MNSELAVGLRYANRMLLVMLLVAAVVAGAVMWAWPAGWTWAAGFVLGTVAGCVKFRVFEVGAVLKLWEQPSRALQVQFQTSLMGLALLGGALLLAYFRRDVFEPIAVAIGFFLPRIVLMLDGFFRPNPFAAAGLSPDADAPGDEGATERKKSRLTGGGEKQ